jgi:hypothetical protein
MAVQCFYESFVRGSSSVFQLSICAENSPLRKAENRSLQAKNPPHILAHLVFPTLKPTLKKPKELKFIHRS